MEHVNLHPYQLRELLRRHDIEILEMHAPRVSASGEIQGTKPGGKDSSGRLLPDLNHDRTILIRYYHDSNSLELANFLADLGFRVVSSFNRGGQTWETCLQAS